MAEVSNSGRPAEKQSGIKSVENPPENEFEKVARSYRSGWLYAEYAFQYGVTIVLCTLVGYWLDNWLNTGNVLLIIFVMFGAVAGFVNLIRGLNISRDGGRKK
jgi:F0F1-type ATP synthase assembly protein I